MSSRVYNLLNKCQALQRMAAAAPSCVCQLHFPEISNPCCCIYVVREAEVILLTFLRGKSILLLNCSLDVQ